MIICISFITVVICHRYGFITFDCQSAADDAIEKVGFGLPLGRKLMTNVFETHTFTAFAWLLFQKPTHMPNLILEQLSASTVENILNARLVNRKRKVIVLCVNKDQELPTRN